MTKNEIIFQKIDKIIERIKKYKIEPDFSKALNERINRKPPQNLTDDKLLEIYAILLAFSQGANSEFVRDRLIKTGHFNKIFHDFSVDKVAKLQVSEVLSRYWTKPLTYIRMKTKIENIIYFAKKIQEYGSLTTLLTNSQIPKRIQSIDDINKFWIAFDVLRTEMKQRKIPFLQSTTTLLHYLLETGYDCIKPDSAIMSVAERLNIVDNKSGENNIRRAISTLFEYSITRNLRPSEVDLYFLIAKPQEGAKKYVRKEFYSNLKKIPSR